MPARRRAKAPRPRQRPHEGAAKTELTDEERAEKQARKACKIKICDILATKEPQGDDVSCDIVKTWREVRHHQDAWRQVRLALGQGGLPVEARRQARAARERHDARRITRRLCPRRRCSCTLAQKSEGEPYAVSVSIAPKVTFENGKAISARLNWGEANAPMLAYALIYAGTGFDNSTNVLGPEVVRMVNEFTGKKCKRVKHDLPSHTGHQPQ